MTEQMTLNDGHARFLRAYLLIRWLAVSLVVAWAAPFFLLALVVAVGSALGVSAGAVRENAVAFATLDPTAWVSAGNAWQVYAWVCGAVALLWRVFSANPVQRLMDAGMRRLEAAATRLFEPVLQHVQRLPRVAQVALVLSLAAALVAVLLFASQPRPDARVRNPVGAAHPLPKAPSSAALTLPSGEIRAGQVTVEQRGADTFVIVFEPAAGK